MVETVFDTLNANAAVCNSEYLTKKNKFPIMVSVITDQSGRTLTGQTTEAFLISSSIYPSIGLNCALGANLMGPIFKF